MTSLVTGMFVLVGMGAAPAAMEAAETGHHHLLITMIRASLVTGEGIPSGDQHRHFGGGQTQATLDLPAGTPRMALVLGDHVHVPHDPVVYSEMIAITVDRRRGGAQ